MPKNFMFATCTVLLILAACGPAPKEADRDDTAPGQTGAPVESSRGKLIIHMADDMAFSPERAVINAGDTVVWIQDGALPHTTSDGPGLAAVPDNSLLAEGAAPWDSGLLDSGESFTLVFDAPGEYTYLCTIHEAAGMVGHITVR